MPRKDASTLRFVFDERKAAEAASRILQLAGGSMKYIDLLMLLYLVDRQSLLETGDEMWSMNQGGGRVDSRLAKALEAEVMRQSTDY